jgi:metallo-beta-lactamase family protein
MTLSLKFCGAAGTVTGSCYLLETEKSRILVDCGMFQGSKSVDELNYGYMGFEPTRIDAVVLTHAHIDHSGLIPRLINEGFKGPVYTTSATRDLLTFMLADSGYIHETETRRRNNRRQQRGKAHFEHVYTEQDGRDALQSIRAVEYKDWISVTDDIRVRFWNAGHILGSASIEVEVGARNGAKPGRFFFSGDLGPDAKAFHSEPEGPSGVDYLICESTYGDRDRNDLDVHERRKRLAKIVDETIIKDGPLLIPVFAIERTQELLSDLVWLMEHNVVEKIPVFLDSPLAVKSTKVFLDYASELEDLVERFNPFQLPNFHFTESVQQSKSLNLMKGARIILSASGMCNAGRIRHHLKHTLWQRNTTVLLTGFQATGTLGRLLLTGKKIVRIHREEVRVEASIKAVDWYSGHADRTELLQWIKNRMPVLKGIFLTHGERESALSIYDAVTTNIAPDTFITIPELDEAYDLEGKVPRLLPDQPAKRVIEEQYKTRDWRNIQAEFLIQLSEKMSEITSNKHRERILSKLADVLGEDKAPRSAEGSATEHTSNL